MAAPPARVRGMVPKVSREYARSSLGTGAHRRGAVGPAAAAEAVDHRLVEGVEDGHEVGGGLPTHRPDGEREVEAAHATDAHAGAERAPGENSGRHETESPAPGHEGQLELVGVGLDRHAEADSGPVERALEECAGRAALRVEDPAAAVEGGEASPARAARAASGLHHDQPLAPEPGGVEARREPLVVGQEDHRRIESAGADALQQIAAPPGAERERDPREGASQPVDRLGERDLGEGVRDPHADLTGGQIVAAGRGAHVADREEHPATALERGLPGRGEGEGSPAPVTEDRTERSLETLYPPGHRGLGEVQLARGATHRPRFRHRHEGPDVVEFHGGILVMPTIHVQHADGAGILSSMATPSAAIVRSWSARATPAGADAYLDHFRSTVLPALRRRAGHRGAMVLRRSQDGLVGIIVLTLWTSMAAVAEFAGADAHAAIVEPAAREVLADFDTHVEHFELALRAGP